MAAQPRERPTANLYAADSNGSIHDGAGLFDYGRYSYQIGLLSAHPLRLQKNTEAELALMKLDSDSRK